VKVVSTLDHATRQVTTTFKPTLTVPPGGRAGRGGLGWVRERGCVVWVGDDDLSGECTNQTHSLCQKGEILRIGQALHKLQFNFKALLLAAGRSGNSSGCSVHSCASQPTRQSTGALWDSSLDKLGPQL
jgi:hypothetical protein